MRRAYRSDLASCFGRPAADPWGELHGGLVLGGEALWEKAKAVLAGLPAARPGARVRPGRGGPAEPTPLRWMRRHGREHVRRTVAALSEGEAEGDKRVLLWARVSLGAERLADLAREFGYADGSGVLHAVQRLEARAKEEPELRRTLARLRAAAAEACADDAGER